MNGKKGAGKRYSTDRIPSAGRWLVYDNGARRIAELHPSRSAARRSARGLNRSAKAGGAW